MKKFVTYHSTPAGLLKLEAGEEHISSILFCEEATNDATETNQLLKHCIWQLDEYFEGRRKQFDFPMQQAGTEFQHKVWQLLVQIPFGKTISYLELSKQYGDVKAIRAVASANGKNSLAIVVPCHRVIGSNAGLTGYAGGLWRKQWLLNHERKYCSGVEQPGLF